MQRERRQPANHWRVVRPNAGRHDGVRLVLPWPVLSTSMARYRRPLALLCMLILVAALAGCATLSKDQCLAGDWYHIGSSDGAHGYKKSRLARHREACAEYGVAPRVDTYFEGRKQGLKAYCSPRNGYEVGLAGHDYNHVCPAELEQDFLYQYTQGKHIYNLLNRIEELENEIDSLTDELTDEDNDRYDRRSIRDDIDRKYRELHHAKWELQRSRRYFGYP